MTGTDSNGKGFARAWRRAAAPRLSGTALFASSVLARYRRVARREEHLQLLLAQPSKTWVLHRHAGRTENRFGVTLHTVVVRTEAAHSEAGQCMEAPTLPVRTVMASAIGPMAAAVPRATLLETSTASRRIATRSARIDSPIDARAPLQQAMPVVAQPKSIGTESPPVRLPDAMPTVRPRVSPPGPTVVEPNARAAAAVITRAPAATTEQTLPPHEVERIAERVLGSIDRRILAERERRGRF